MNLEKVRSDFPFLNQKIKGQYPIYFDSACQTLRPKSVINAIVKYYESYPACAGRSAHKAAVMVTNEVSKARKNIAKFINASSQNEIIFTRNTTEAINLLANSLNLKKGDVVLTTDKEHNSNLIPWQILVKKKEIIHKVIPSKKDNTFDLDAFKKELKGKVKLISIILTSNIDGTTVPIKEIIKEARKKNILVLLDAAQAVPHKKIDVKKINCDFLCFSGHKMLGPSGTGILWGKYKLLEQLEPFMLGGETVLDSTYKTHKLLGVPEKFEAGLQNFAGIIGLSEAVSYLEKIGFNNIIKQENLLNKLATDKLSKIKNLEFIGPLDPYQRGGIVNFFIRGIDHHRIALMLDESKNIMVRSGQHCVHSWYNDRKIPGSVRASFYFYNTLEEVEIFSQELEKIIKILG
ncbi:MAG: cysteine desulfurase [Patescibacteria group bacterium]